MQNDCSEKCCKIYKKTLALESSSKKFTIPALLKKDSFAGVFLRFLQKNNDNGYFTKHVRAAVSVRRLDKETTSQNENSLRESKNTLTLD